MTTATELTHSKDRRRRDSDSQRACPECGGRLEDDPRHGETACLSCGLVVDDTAIDYGPEWRAYNASESASRSRTGAPMTESLHDRGLSTVIGFSNRDGGGKRIPASNRLHLARLRRLHRQTSSGSGTDRNLAVAITEIRRIASALNVSRDVAEQAIRLYRRAADADLIRGRSIDGMSAATVYAACRLNGIPRDLDQIAEASHVDRRTLHRTFRTLTHALDINVPVLRSTDHVPRFASALDLPPEAVGRALDVLRRAEDQGLASGRAPTSLAAAAVLAVAKDLGEGVTQKAVAEATGVSEVTIRHRLRELAPLLAETPDNA